MAEKKKNSFRDMMLIIFVVVVCFGLTIYGIVYLTSKVFNGDTKTVPAAVTPPVTNPDNGDILTFSAGKDNTTSNQNAPIVDEAPKPATTPAKTPQAQPAPTPIQNQVAAPKPVETPAAAPKAPQKNEEPKPVKQETPKTEKQSFKGKYAVQLMAVKSKDAAENEALKYKKSIPDIFIVRADLGDKGVWYRIRCGATDSKNEAEIMRKKLSTELKIDAQVVNNN